MVFLTNAPMWRWNQELCDRLDGSRCGFSSEGKLIWIDDEKGNELSLTYDAQGHIETVSDAASARVLTFHYVNDLLDHIMADKRRGFRWRLGQLQLRHHPEPDFRNLCRRLRIHLQLHLYQ